MDEKKKILGICASGHENGNSQIILNELLKPSQKKGYTVEILNIGKMNILQCNGCFACMNSRKPEKCIIKDDLDLIKGKIQEADAIAIASPSYCLSTPSRLRSVIERTASWALGEMAKSNKKRFGAAVSVASGTSSLVKTPLSLFMALYQCEIVGQFTITNAFHQGEVLLYPSKLKQVAKLGEALADSVTEKRCIKFKDESSDNILKCTNCYSDTFQVQTDGTLLCPICRMKLKCREKEYHSEGFNRFSHEGARLYVNGIKNVLMKKMMIGPEISKRLNAYLKDGMLPENDFSMCVPKVKTELNIYWDDEAIEALEAWLPSNSREFVKNMIEQQALKFGISNITKELLLNMN